MAVIMFGGNGFLGGYVAEELLRIGADIMTVNRGNSYWDTERYLGGRVANQTCDRDANPRVCTHFFAYASSLTRVDVVVDFTAWNRGHVARLTELMGNKPRLYVYVSSSLIYELSPVEKPNGEGYREEDSGRHSDPAMSNERISLNVYANGKFEGEDGYHHAHIVRQANVLVLRVGQLFGPRESLFRYPLRWMTWQLWVALAGRAQTNVTLTFPSWLETHQFDLAYVRDVARLVEQLRFAVNLAPAASGARHSYTVLNVAYEQKFTVRQLVLAIAEALRTDVTLVQSRIRFTPARDTPRSAVELTFPSHFPATRFGVMNTSKLADLAPTFRTTDFATAVRETVDFYTMAIVGGKFDKQVRIAADRLVRLGVTTEDFIQDYFRDLRAQHSEKLTQQRKLWEREQMQAATQFGHTEL